MFRRNSNINTQYNGNVQTLSSDVLDPSHQYMPGSGYPAYHYHSQMSLYRVNVAIYNDYDINGNLLGTYMLNHGYSFNTSLPTISIDETKFDKHFNAFKQDTTLSSLVTLSNAQSVPSLGGATVTVTKDVAAGSITFNYKPSFIFSNGTLQKYTGSGVSKVIDGFSLLNTYILSKAGYSDVIVVDRFINSIRKDDIIDPEELGKYLDLSSVPPGSSYSILDSSLKLI